MKYLLHPLVGACASVAIVFAMQAPASAYERYTGGTPTSTTKYNTDDNSYIQDRGNTDFGWLHAKGSSIDGRWITCDGRSIDSSPSYDIHVTGNRVTIGKNFRAGTCLKFQWRASNSVDVNKRYEGTIYWNWDFTA